VSECLDVKFTNDCLIRSDTVCVLRTPASDQHFKAKMQSKYDNCDCVNSGRDDLYNR